MAWQPTPVFLLGEPPWTEEPGGLPWGHKESDTMEWLSIAQHMPFPECNIYIVGIISYVAFSHWLSLNPMYTWFLYAFSWFGSSFLFHAKTSLFGSTTVYLFSHPLNSFHHQYYGESKVWYHKEQHCIGTWNNWPLNQGKLDVAKQKMARLMSTKHWLLRNQWIKMNRLLWARIP